MDASNITKIILEEIRDSPPDNIDELVTRITLKYDIPRNQILKIVTQLVDEEKITLKVPLQDSPKLAHFLFSIKSAWFWLEILLCSFSVASIYLIRDDSHPLIYVRNIMGFLFSLFLPGYAFIKAILPYKEFSLLERILLSFGSSVAFVPFIGLFLNHLNNLSLIPILSSIYVFTILLSMIGILREYLKVRVRTS